MLNRVLEIAEENRYISLNRGFITIKNGDTELGSVPLDDISVLVLSAQSITLTKNVLNAISEHGCITIFCGKNYKPVSMVLPIATHSLFTKIIKYQINATLPFKKKIWQQIIISKVTNQAIALKICNKENESLLIEKIATMVKSGDPDNREAYAARMYWQSLFGKNFIRDKDGDGINALLNYGYAIIRAAMARAICSHGLIPALGVHHDNNLNQFCLADDFFELYRPFVDVTVYKLWISDEKELTSDTKKTLASLLKAKLSCNGTDTNLIQSMEYMVSSYVTALEEKRPVINLPYWEGIKDGITIIE